MKKYYDIAAHRIITENDLLADWESITDCSDTIPESFQEFVHDAIEWQDIIELDADDIEKLNSEKCYFNRESYEILTESQLRKGFEMYAWGIDFDNYDDFIANVTAPYESLTELQPN